MTTPAIDHDDRRDSLAQALIPYMEIHDDRGDLAGFRQDVLAVLKFMVPDTPSVHDAVHLFWNIRQSQMMGSCKAEDGPGWIPILSEEDIRGTIHRSMNPPSPATSPQLDRLLLDCLDWMYERFQVRYQPDVDDAGKLLALVIELHIAAARAFKLKQIETDHISEEWVSRLRSVERTSGRIRAITDRHEGTSFASSTHAVSGMTQLELSRVCTVDGSYAGAIHHLNRAATSYIWALDGIEDGPGDGGPRDVNEDNPWTMTLDWDEESVRSRESSVLLDLRLRLAPLEVSLEEAASLFGLLKQSTRDANWRRVADDCLGLAILPDLEWEIFTGVDHTEIIEDEETEMALTWSEFWHSARAWASAQLSPSEYRRMLDDNERTAAERRLKNYFSGSDWEFLSGRAQRRLINADNLLNSTQRVALEALVNDLRIATEELCYPVVWQPLSKTRTPPLEFIRENSDWRSNRDITIWAFRITSGSVERVGIASFLIIRT